MALSILNNGWQSLTAKLVAPSAAGALCVLSRSLYSSAKAQGAAPAAKSSANHGLWGDDDLHSPNVVGTPYRSGTTTEYHRRDPVDVWDHIQPFAEHEDEPEREHMTMEHLPKEENPNGMPIGQPAKADPKNLKRAEGLQQMFF